METAAVLTRDSAVWLEVLAINGAANPTPLTREISPHAETPGRLLPLWLEPSIDYQTAQVLTACDLQGRLPSRPVRAHETVHWALVPRGATTRRCLGLEGLCDVGTALLTGDPVMAVPAVPGLTRDLRYPAFDATAPLSTQAHLRRVLQVLRHGSGISRAVIDQVEHVADEAPDHDIQLHAFGVPLGHWLWEILKPLPRDVALRCLIQAAAVPQTTPAGTIQAVVEVLPRNAQFPAHPEHGHADLYRDGEGRGCSTRRSG